MIKLLVLHAFSDPVTFYITYLPVMRLTEKHSPILNKIFPAQYFLQDTKSIDGE